MRTNRLRMALAAIAPLFLAVGCAGDDGESVDDRLAKLDSVVPAMGTVTVDGKPLAGVVVTFVPEEWGTAHGETDEEGRFTLETGGRPGAIPGEYRVVLSYLVTPDGRALGLGARGGLTPNPDLTTAREKLPPSASSVEQSSLTAVVPPGGTTDLAFSVGPLAETPAATTPGPEKPAGDEPAQAPAGKPAEAPKG